ncbi:uncharacterized protein LOC131994766 [Stomoxys calcitrans]|uniref:uncharacterized protein LOC131994766 n=1 Tax=Stomoxys calcitrans TaxID=35570 RepID=UPI0027E2D4DE|nr:uncharacterized protein LOC131994766 [Stomoxys calcitrans]
MADNLELISKFNNKNLKPILNVKDMVLHHEYVIDGCYRTTTKYLIMESLAEHICVKFNFQLQAQYTKLCSDEWKKTIMHHTSKMSQITRSDSIENVVSCHVEEIKTKMSEFQERDSGWALVNIEKLYININKCTVLRGSQYIKTPKKLADRRACCNILNDDEYCFKWCMVAALTTPKPRNPTRTSSYPVDIKQNIITLTNGVSLNFNGLNFPMALRDIIIFEKNNPNISVNVLGYEVKTDHVVGPYYITQMEKETHVNLLLLENNEREHYVLVRDTSRLLHRQVTSNANKLYFCNQCFQHTRNPNMMDHHKRECGRVVTYLPEEANKFMEFSNSKKTMDVPFSIYADFECVLENVNDSNSKSLSKHIPCAFSYNIKCSFDDRLDKFNIYTGEDAAEVFVKSIDQECRFIYENYLSLNTPMTSLSPSEEFNFQVAQNCHVCEKLLGSDRVRDHCHITGKYRGPAHNKCNLEHTVPTFIPIFFHNFSAYDCHLFVKDLLKNIPGNTTVLPENKERYIALSHKVYLGGGKILEYRFLDSLRFMAASLDSLANNLAGDTMKSVRSHFPSDREFNLMRKKGVFCYEYLTSFDKLAETRLPPIEAFFSKLYNKKCSSEDYTHAKEVWHTFNCGTLQDYMELYLKTDVLLLTDVFENFRRLCKKVHKLDPCQYYTAPGLSFDAMLRNTNISLELFTDLDMYNFIKNAIRGGITQCSRRHTKANNRYLSDFNPLLLSTFLMYFDVNNLYGAAMMRFLPCGDFKWLKENEIISDVQRILDFVDDSPIGYIYEVDLDYPDHLHDHHNDLPFAAENKKIGGAKYKKLVADLTPKRNYTTHYLVLKQCLENGLILKKVHRVLEFRQEPWLAPFVNTNTDERKKATNPFEKDFFKLLNNSVYGKTMENVDNRKDVKLVTEWEYSNKKKIGLERLISKPNFNSLSQFSNEFWAVQMDRTKVIYDKPIYVGFCILEIAKLIMYDFHYNYMKKKFGERCQLNYMDTDSFIYTISSEDFYAEIKDDVEKYFDTSNYDANNPFGFPLKNKKEMGYMKDENGGTLMSEFVGLGPKMYSYKLDEGSEINKAKGVKKCVIEGYSLENYKECLLNGIKPTGSMLSFRSKLHNIYTDKLTKVVLSPLDTKRKIREDKINTYAWGHYKMATENNLQSISIDYTTEMDVDNIESYSDNDLRDLLDYLNM